MLLNNSICASIEIPNSAPLSINDITYSLIFSLTELSWSKSSRYFTDSITILVFVRFPIMPSLCGIFLAAISQWYQFAIHCSVKGIGLYVE